MIKQHKINDFGFMRGDFSGLITYLLDMMTEPEILAALRAIQKQIEQVRLAMDDVRREFNLTPTGSFPVLVWSSDADPTHEPN